MAIKKNKHGGVRTFPPVKTKGDRVIMTPDEVSKASGRAQVRTASVGPASKVIAASGQVGGPAQATVSG
jgi:hypothetical protein